MPLIKYQNKLYKTKRKIKNLGAIGDATIQTGISGTQYVVTIELTPRTKIIRYFKLQKEK